MLEGVVPEEGSAEVVGVTGSVVFVLLPFPNAGVVWFEMLVGSPVVVIPAVAAAADVKYGLSLLRLGI